MNCGGAAFDLETEREALRFSLSQRTRLRAGMGAGIGCVIGFVHSAWLQGDTHDRHYLVLLAWVFALAAVGAVMRRRPIAALDDQLGADRASKVRRANLTMAAIGALVIIADTTIAWHAQATTMPKKEGEKLVVNRMCEVAQTCNKHVFCLAAELNVDLQIGHARVDRSDVDDCLHALDEIAARREACAPPPIPACEAVTRMTIAHLLDDARKLDRDLDRIIDKEIQKSIDRLPPPR